MYEIKKSRRITEDVEFSSGDERLLLHVDIDLGRMARKISLAQVTLANARRAAQSQDPEDLKEYGEAAIALLQLVFGDENTEKILEFYEDDYIQLVFDVMPFIYEVIIPEVSRESKRKRSQYKRAKWSKR